jgi:hypothetical protein
MPLRKALRDTLRARRDRLALLDSGLVKGDTPSAAAATLASVISETAEEAGVKLGSVQVRPDSARAGTAVTLVAVRADAVGDIRGLTLLLAEIEAGVPLLRVRELSVSQPAPAAPDTQAEALRVELLIEGLARTTARVPASASTTGRPR